MSYLGSWKLNDYLTWALTSHVATTGAISDADANPTYRIYEDNVGTVVVSGSLTLLDDANTTGFYHNRLQILSASGFEKGKDYNILNKATVNGISGQIVHNFQIEAEVDANVVSDKVGYNVQTGSLNYVGTANVINDKTGYSVDTLNDTVTVGTNLDKTGYALAGNVIVGTNLDKTGYNVQTGSLNYVGTANIINDKTGYALAGNVTVGTNLDKTGYTVSTLSASANLTANSIDDILDEVVENSITLRQAISLIMSKLMGKASGGGTTSVTFRDTADSKDRITMTVDSNGNRTAVTLDGS